MKKSVISLLTVLFLTGLYFAACTPSAAEKEKARLRRSMTANPITWDTICVNKKGTAQIDALCAVNIKFIVPKIYEKEEVIRAIQRELNYALVDDDSLDDSLSTELIDKYADEYIAEYIQEVEKNHLLWQNEAEPIPAYTKMLESTILFDQANLISYQLKGLEYSGADTTALIYENMVFDLADGKKLNEEDIFREGYQDQLNKALIEQLLRNNGVATTDELQELGYWGAADIATNSNFYITESGITYTYNPGEYAESELGVLNISISFDDLADMGLLKKESSVSILFQGEDAEQTTK